MAEIILNKLRCLCYYLVVVLCLLSLLVNCWFDCLNVRISVGSSGSSSLERDIEMRKLCKNFVDRLRYVFQYLCRWPCFSCSWPKLFRPRRWRCPCWASICSLPWFSSHCPFGQRSVCWIFTSGKSQLRGTLRENQSNSWEVAKNQ